MTTQPVEKLVCKMAGPTIVIMMVSAMYNMADTYFVGFLGTSATAAVGVSFSLMAVIQAIGFFFGHGSGNSISRMMGAQNTGDAEKMASTGFFSAFITGLVFAAAGLIFLAPLARFLGATDTSLPYARTYLRFILLGMPFMTSSLVLNNLLRFQGSAFIGMIGVTSGAVLNIILDPLFIFALGMGLKGAALATMISQMVSCALLFIIGNTGRQNIRITPRNFSIRRETYREMFRGGIPSLLRQGLLSLSTVFLNRAAGVYGDAAIAAITIVNRVFLLAFSALIGWGQGFQPVCGFNYGAGRYDRVKKAFWFCVYTATAVLSVLGVIAFIFAPQIITIFRKNDPEVISVGSFALRAWSLTLPLSAWIVMNNMMLQTIGKALAASILALARQGLFLISFLFILVPFLGIRGIQLCLPLADFCTFLLALPMGISALGKDLAEDPAGLREKGGPENRGP
ncbi:MAG: MATE family efflux transporter [Treponema sp.]|jgi:putative MATE family efflux protein|nr:MATE family efflux transporter [Treponema sp.]